MKRRRQTVLDFADRVECARSRIQGVGVFARGRLPGRRKIGELGGEVRLMEELMAEIGGERQMYVVELIDGWALDCRKGTRFKYLNHSCRPNCFLRRRGLGIEVFTLRSIRPGEELTVDYICTPHDGGMRCRCGAEGCRGTL
jgi:SET domain-containing protein